MTGLVADYGFVPFPHFQAAILAAQLALVRYHKQVNAYIDARLPKHPAWAAVKKLALSIPLLLIAYYDIRYSSFSLKNLGVPPAYNAHLNQVLFILGSYGIIQVLAQDSGIRTGVSQRDSVQSYVLFSLIAVGMAYSITQNRSQSMIALLLYFHLKYVISDNVTSAVCFEPI
jgi:hypothetical protein